MVFQFQLSKKHVEFQKSINDMLSQYKNIEETQVYERLSQDGYTYSPKIEGAVAWDYLAMVLFIEELSKSYPRLANTIVESIFAQELVLSCAESEHKVSCATSIARQERRVNVLFSEPGNYEMQLLKTKITKQGDKYLVSGSKLFAPENSNCDKMLIIGKLADSENNKLAVAAIPREELQIETKEINFGNSTLSTVFATVNSEVASDKVFLNVTDQLRAALAIWRTLIAASSIGLAHTNLVSPLSILRGIKNHDNQALTNSQSIQFTLADMYAEIEGAKMVTYYSAALIDVDKPSTRFSSIAKVQATEAVVFSTNQGAMLFGNLGNVYDSKYLETLQLAYNRQIKDGTPRNSYNIIYEEALARR